LKFSSRYSKAIPEIKKKMQCFAKRFSMRQIICFMLLLVLFFSDIPVVSATQPTIATAIPKDYAGVKPENTFVFTVVTGEVVTDNILYFAVHYIDSSNKNRTHFIMPQEYYNYIGYSNLRVVASVGSTNCGALDCINFLKEFGYTAPAYDSVKAFSSGAKDEYIFTPDFTVKKIVGIDVMTRSESVSVKSTSTNSKSYGWACQFMAIYKVDTLYGLDAEGSMSSKYYIDYKGTLQALMRNNTNSQTPHAYSFDWKSSDKLWRLTDSINNTAAVSVDLYDTAMPAIQAYEESESNDASSLVGKKLVDFKNYVNYDTRSNSKDFIFKIDLADEYGAWFEAMTTPYGVYKSSNPSAASPLKTGLFEALAMEITYIDSANLTRKVSIPVVLSSLKWAYENSMSAESASTTTTTGAAVAVTRQSAIMGYLQQGESVALSAKLPNFVSFKSVVLRVGPDAAKASVGISNTKGSMEKKFASDSIAMTGLQIYDSATTKAQSVLEYGFIRPQILEGAPEYYFTAGSTSGVTILTSTSTTDTNACTVLLDTYDGDPSCLAPKESTRVRYLVKLVTDEMTAAGTKDPFSINIHYKSIDGLDKSTGLVDVKEGSQNYYGYWPGSSGDVSFAQGASAGGTIDFLVTLTNLSYFTGLTLSMDEDCTDDYQLKDIQVYRISSFGQRNGLWEDVTLQGTKLSDRSFYRQIQTIDISPDLQSAVLLRAGESKTISFETGGTVKVLEDDVDWSSYQYSMSYSESCQNLGFTKTRTNYYVQVKVSANVELDSSESASIGGEDCGSNNKFYFQLIMENGNSAYVLANQQLEADGFRTGYTESFTICTNQDYGDIRAIHIIPEGINDNDDAYDKLRVSYIKVTKMTDEGVCMTWRSDVNDWIGIDYVEEGSKSSIMGMSGRSEAELSRSFVINSQGYSMNFLFALSTNHYDDVPFDGKLSAVVEYIDVDGDLQTQTINIPKQCYDFVEKAVPTTDYTCPNGQKIENVVSIDRNWMLREGHTDYFKVPIDNCVSLERATLHIESATCGIWHIDGLSVYQIDGEGSIVLNSKSEYILSNVSQQPVTKSNVAKGYSIFYTADSVSHEITMEFEENTIEVNLNGGGWASTISYLPESRDDTINIYAYVTENTGANLEDMVVNATTNYHVSIASVKGADGTDQNAVDQDLEAIQQLNDYTSADGKTKMFYVKGVKVSGISLFQSLTLQATSIPSGSTCVVSDVIVEHVRSGVIVKTYYLEFNKDIVYGVTKTPDNTNQQVSQEQVFTFMFNGGSSRIPLITMKDDIVISFNYSTLSDPETGDRKSQFTSPNIFLSEMGTSTTDGNLVCSVLFDQENVKDISNVTLTALGDCKKAVSLHSAYLTNYQVETVNGTEKRSILSSYYFSEGSSSKLSEKPMVLSLTGSTSSSAAITTSLNPSVADLTLTFTTAGASASGESGTTDPIRMTLYYINDSEQDKSVVYEDINDYLVSGSFATGQTATIRMLVPGLKSVRSVKVEPYDTDIYATSSWTVEKVSMQLFAGDKIVPKIRQSGKTALEDVGLNIGLADIVLNTEAYISRLSTTGFDQRGYSSTAKSGAEGILISYGQYINFMPTISGSISGCTVELMKVSVQADGSKATSSITEQLVKTAATDTTGEVYTFTPANESAQYRFVLTSQEISDYNLTIDITVTSVAAGEEVEEKEEPTEEPVEDPTEESDEEPTEEPAEDPTEEPAEDPNAEPSGDPTERPVVDPSTDQTIPGRPVVTPGGPGTFR